MEGLSVIIPSFNTKEMTLKSVHSVEQALVRSKTPFEVIIVDNASHDGSAVALTALSSDKVKVIRNSENAGYGKANNQALRIARYSHILYLNSDVVVGESIDFADLLRQFREDKHLGGLTVRVNLGDGNMDKASHRGFPTLWRSACYFGGLERLFGHVPLLNRWFGGYHLTYRDLSLRHEIDSPTGAFYMAPRNLLMKLKGFDEDFFMYGEDLDLSFRIKQLGYKIIFDPKYTVIHYKYKSGLKNGKNNGIQKKTRNYFYESMGIFYKKHYQSKYPDPLNRLVYTVINLKAR